MYRMKKFYETYKKDEFVSTLLSQISWSNHLAIMSKAKTEEERHFYITLYVKENYSARELSRQIDSGYYERYMLSKEKLLYTLAIRAYLAKITRKQVFKKHMKDILEYRTMEYYRRRYENHKIL